MNTIILFPALHSTIGNHYLCLKIQCAIFWGKNVNSEHEPHLRNIALLISNTFTLQHTIITCVPHFSTKLYNTTIHNTL